MKKIRTFLKVILIIIVGYLSYVGVIVNKFDPGNRENVCGTVRYKNDKLHEGKYKTTTDYIIVVEYGGYLYDQNVSYATFATRNIGSSYCIDIFKPVKVVDVAGLIVGAIVSFIIVCVIVLTVVNGVVWVFTGEPLSDFPIKWKKEDDDD